MVSAANDGPQSRPPLTRQVVLRKALELVDAEGLSSLTRRRLGQELGRDAMTLYRYVPDRNALLEGIVELVLMELPASGEEQEGWQPRLRRGAHDFRNLALAHPNVVSVMVTQPLVTPLGLRSLGNLRPLEALLKVLTDAGMTPREALQVCREYLCLLNGHLLIEMQELVTTPDETDDVLRLGLQRLPVEEFPHLRGLASELANYDGAAELDRSLDIFFGAFESAAVKR